VRDAAQCAAYFAAAPVDGLKITPSHLQALVSGGDRAVLPRRWLVCGGEALPAALLARVAGPGAVFNHYGPTETTVGVVAGPAVADPVAGVVPLGRPLAGTRVYVVDGAGALVPVGLAGELYVGGAGVARGYWGQPGLTAARFGPDPWGPPGARVYRTGDRGRWRADGTLEFLGRLDGQVKLRGYRVELGEVDAVAGRCAGVAQCAARVWGERLVLYVVGAAAPAAVQAALRAQLPDYMVPSQVVPLAALPLTGNGKVDRAALPPPPRETTEAHVSDFLDSTELHLIDLWREILGVQSVNPSDNFFEVGGSSLTAVAVCARLGALYPKPVAVRTIFDRPTIRELASFLRQDISPAPPVSVVPITRRGSGAPLFCIHAAGGVPHSYVPLARCLDPTVAVCALQASGIDGTRPPLTCVEAMADRYIADVRAFQPEGAPYRLCGWSFGGLVAHEMALRLRAAGERIELLLLLDTVPRPGADDASAEEPDLEVAERAYLARRLAERHGATEAWLSTATFDEQLHRLTAALAEAGEVASDVTPAQLHNFLRVTVINTRAARRYRPGPYHGTVTLFRSAQTAHASATYGWDQVASRIVVHRFDASHDGFIGRDHAPAVARRILEILQIASPAAAACCARAG
jgi:thioesterase domain-containing protein